MKLIELRLVSISLIPRLSCVGGEPGNEAKCLYILYCLFLMELTNQVNMEMTSHRFQREADQLKERRLPTGIKVATCIAIVV